MEFHSVHGGTKEALLNHEYNIGVGISLGNKWFTIENTLELTKWALGYTRDFVVIYVADSIHAINLEVRNRISYEKASKLANEMGDEFLKDFKEKVDEELSADEKHHIVYAKWDKLITPAYKEKLLYLYGRYTENGSFREAIQAIVKEFTAKERRNFSEQEINRLGDYIVEEFPEVLSRVPIDGYIYDAYAYPFSGSLTKLVEQIQLGTIFPEIRENVMDTEPKIFLEVR
jgi:tRNA-dependent cyclodipeptide synthase